MPEFLHFWGKCIVEGWHFGHSIFAWIEGACIIIAAASRWHQLTLLSKNPEWEKQVMKWAVAILAVSFLISTVFVAPFLQHQESKKIETNLAIETNRLAIASDAEKKESTRLNGLLQSTDAAFRSEQAENSKLLHENSALRTDNVELKSRVDKYEILYKDNTVIVRSDIPTSLTPLYNRLLSKSLADELVSRLSEVKPLDTVIRVTSRDPETKALAAQIKDVFSRGGFHIMHEYTDPPTTWGGLEFTNGVVFLMRDLPEPKLTDVMGPLLIHVGSRVQWSASTSYEAPLVIIIGGQ